MKRVGKLFEEICCIQNLHEAYYKGGADAGYAAAYGNGRTFPCDDERTE